MLRAARCRLAILFPLLLGALPAQDARRHDANSADRGLPRDPAAFRPYHDDATHPANRVFRALWLQHATPAEVGPTIRRQDAMDWSPGWPLRKRAGTADDARWFGGDGRLLPLEGLDATAERELLTLLATLTPTSEAVRELTTAAPLAVLFQHDLLRAAERLLETKQNPALVPELARVARAVALPRAALAQLADPLPAAAAADAALRAQLPTTFGGSRTDMAEVLRRSTRLFDAEKSLLWSRVFLAHPAGKDALAALLPKDGAAAGKGPTVPIGFAAVLVQGIVAFDVDGAPHATALAFDVRTQVLRNRDAAGADNATFTHDGLEFAIWQLEREGLRRGSAAAFFRPIAADDQDLFRDYGTGKHTTYRAQCALCHRLASTPEPELGGFVVLRPHAQAAFAATGDERLRLAETQAKRLWDRAQAAQSH